MSESFKTIPGSLGRGYEVSDMGRVRNAISGTILSQSLVNGYPRVAIRRKSFIVHRLVALTFIPGNPRLHVDHIDGDRANCRASNLRWCTPKENNRYSREAGRWRHPAHGRNNRKVTEAQVIEIRKRAAVDHSGVALKRLARAFDVRPITVHSIVFGRTWKHLPYTPPRLLTRGRKKTLQF